MSIIDKQLFATELRERLSDKLTVKDIEAVISELTFQMSYYEMTRKESDSAKQDFFDMVNIFVDTKLIEGRSQKTLDHYKYILKRFCERDSV